jgi:hypothetical protein
MLIRKALSLLVEFLKIWGFMLFTFLTLRILCNLYLFNYIDLRRLAILETLVVPLGQTVAFWLVVKAFRKPIIKLDRPT